MRWQPSQINPILVVCVVVLIISLLLHLEARKQEGDDTSDGTYGKLIPIDSMVGEHSGGLSRRYDCLKTNIFCTNTIDCFDMCTTDIVFGCDATSGLCRPTRNVVDDDDDGGGGDNGGGGEVDTNRACDGAHGFSSVLTVDEFTGAHWTCLNELSGLFDDNNKLLPHVCSGGVFEINVLDSYPNVTDCMCPSGTVRVVHQNAPNVPRCINSSLLQFFDEFIHIE